MVKSMQLRINWAGLAGGVTTILVVIMSLIYPWWQLKIGNDLFTANVSPLNTGFYMLGKSVTMPLFWAVNIAGLLTFLASGVTMIIYSLLPSKPYSKALLDFAHKKPLYTLLTFTIFLCASTLLARELIKLDVPLSGSTNSTVPIPLFQGTTIGILISTGFQLPFWLALVATGLCIGARIYHKRIIEKQEQDVILEAAIPIAPEATIPQAA